MRKKREKKKNMETRESKIIRHFEELFKQNFWRNLKVKILKEFLKFLKKFKTTPDLWTTFLADPPTTETIDVVKN